MTDDEGRALLAETVHHLDPKFTDLMRRITAHVDATDEPVAECPECGQDVAAEFDVSAGSHADTLRSLLGSVAAGRVSPEDAARLIESWPGAS